MGLYCRGQATRVDPDPGLQGDWLAASYCATGTAICGYRQKVEATGTGLGIGDDTGLNAVELACCPYK